MDNISTPTVERQTVTREEAQRILGVGRNTLDRMIQRGELPSFKAGSRRLARFHAERDRAAFIGLLGKLAIFFTACCAVSVAIVLVAGRPILTALYTAEYAGETSILLLLTISFGVGALVSIFGFGITAARRFLAQVPLVAMSVVVAIVASALLIPRMGAIGAAWAVLVSLTAWSVASAYVLWTVLRDLEQPATEGTSQ